MLLALVITLNFLRHDIAATCVLEMLLNLNHPSLQFYS